MFGKKFIVLFFIIVNYLYSFNDLNYLFQKYKLRKTVETLEALKTLYPKYSDKYIKIQQLENYFMRKVPLDAYSTYVRIKLHNIIDNKLEEENSKKKIQEENNVLKSNTNLYYLYQLKLEKERAIKQKENQNNQTLGGKIPAATAASNSKNPFGTFGQQQFNQITKILGK